MSGSGCKTRCSPCTLKPACGEVDFKKAALQTQYTVLRDITAVDANPAMFPYAQKALAAAYGGRAPPHVTFLKGRAEALPVKSSTMSAVVSTLVRFLHALPVCVACRS